MIDLTKYEGHTPGPWRIGTPPPNGQQTIGTCQGLMVAVATTGFEMGRATLANACLIAAAPELLDEVKRLRQDLHDTIRESQQYRAERDEALAILRMYMQATPISASMDLNTCYGHARRCLDKHGASE